MLKELQEKIDLFKNFTNQKEGELNSLLKSIEDKKVLKLKLEKENERNLIKKALIDDSCTSARENAKELLSTITTSLVQSVFDENTRVNFDITTKDSVSNADVVVLNDYEGQTVEIDPSNDDGGGLADVVSLSLLIGLNQTLENNFAPFVLDEPSKYISKGELSENFAVSFKNLIHYTNKQTIISTHDECLLEIADVKYNILKDWSSGISNVSK